MLNSQTPEKRVHHDGSVLSVHSIFHTIQGEGPFCGTPAVFVRLAGCNLQCPLCDTDYTTGRQNLPIDQILHVVCDYALNHATKLVVITGGEPFRQNLDMLLQVLIKNGFFVQIETNGTFQPAICSYVHGWNYSWDIAVRKGVYIVCSPKAGKVHPEIHRLCCAYKYVGSYSDLSEVDGLPLHPLEHPSANGVPRPQGDKLVYLQPTDHQDEFQNAMSQRAVVESCMKFGHILQLQIHKIIGAQ